MTQERVRDEILVAKRDVLKSTGTDEIPFSYYEKMPLLVALIKVYRNLMDADDSQLTLWYIGDAQGTSGRVPGCQTGA
jgi:hypothetical protein